MLRGGGSPANGAIDGGGTVGTADGATHGERVGEAR
eukprot:gene25836-26312_t